MSALATELLVDVGVATALEVDPVLAATGTGKLLVPMEVRVSGHTVVDTGTIEVTTEVDDAGQLDTDGPQPNTVT